MKKKKAFTLIEVLIVMGIIVILMGLFIAVGRWSIRRSNRVHHMSAAQSLERALLRFKNEEGYVPRATGEGQDFFADSLGYTEADPLLKQYLEPYPFEGGTDATYYYVTDDLGQFFVVCVSFGGVSDENNLGHYCTGTGIGFVPEDNPIVKEEIEPDNTGQRAIINGINYSDWLKDVGFARASEVN